MHEMEEQVREIQKEIIESRGLLIKTNNLINSLAADLKTIAKRQTNYERKLTWNGAAAYVLFAALSFVGLKLASDAMIREMESEQQTLLASVKKLHAELAERERKATLRERAEKKAAEFYELVRAQKRSEAVVAYESVRKEMLSPAEENMFQDIHGRFRVELSMAAYQNGLERARNARWEEALRAFEEALRLGTGAPHIHAVKLQLGLVLVRLGRAAQAMPLAKAVLEQTLDRELHDDAMWLAALCAQAADQKDDARMYLRNLQRKWPRSPLALEARSKLSELR